MKRGDSSSFQTKDFLAKIPEFFRVSAFIVLTFNYFDLIPPQLEQLCLLYKNLTGLFSCRTSGSQWLDTDERLFSLYCVLFEKERRHGRRRRELWMPSRKKSLWFCARPRRPRYIYGLAPRPQPSTIIILSGGPLIHFRVVVAGFCPADILTYFLTCNLVVVQEFFRARVNAISRYNALTWLAKIWRPKSFFSSFCGGGSARGWKILILDLTSKREKTEESPIECNEMLVIHIKLKRRGIYIAIVA